MIARHSHGRVWRDQACGFIYKGDAFTVIEKKSLYAAPGKIASPALFGHIVWRDGNVTTAPEAVA